MSYILYGATANTIGKIFPYLRNLGIKEEVLYLCDSDSTKWGNKIGQWTIYPKEEIKNNPEAVIIILAQSIKAIVNDLRANGIQNKVVSYPWFRWNYVDIPMTDENLVKNKTYIETIEEKLYHLYQTDDSYTKNILAEIIRERKMVSWQLIENVEQLEEFHSVHDYFYDMELAPKEEVTFIDGGAYDGDSIETVYRIYGNRLKKIYAFEPARENVTLMQENLSRMGLSNISTCFAAGISDKDGKLYLSDAFDDGMGYRLSETESDDYVEVKKVDSLDLEIVGEAMLKMDIEGSELAALKGAEKFIQTYHPYMAICLYHKMEDIYEIPAYIQSICDEYDFYLRAGGHLECYAVPRNKK